MSAVIALVIIAAITTINAGTFPRLDREVPKAGDAEGSPVFVSVLIPARNEAATIGESIRQHLRQDYPAFEIIILDDNSTDGTARIARKAAEAVRADYERTHRRPVPRARVRVLTGRPLPKGWSGKNWACHQLAKAANGKILVFTDADVIWTAGALKRLITEMTYRDSDLQTVWPTQITETWTERLVVPLMGFVIVGYLPLLAVHHIRWPIFAAAMGQCLAFRRDAYTVIGGHAAVRAEVIEDVAFAKRIKRAGLRLRVADGGGVIRCRMYQNWREVRNGFAKNILAGHGNSIPFLLLSWAFHWLLWLAPWVWLGVGAFVETPWWPMGPILVIFLGVGIRALTAAFTLQRVQDAVWMPVSTLLIAIIAAQSIWWHLHHGGPQWSGRSLPSRGAKRKGIRATSR
jgi:chlorobactene glucosyltransferase